MWHEVMTSRDNREWQGVTGLDNESFTKICKRSNEIYYELNGQSYQEMLAQNPKGDQARFKTLNDHLFFVLLMLKSGITFDLLGFIFKINQPNAHRSRELLAT